MGCVEGGDHLGKRLLQLHYKCCMRRGTKNWTTSTRKRMSGRQGVKIILVSLDAFIEGKFMVLRLSY